MVIAMQTQTGAVDEAGEERRKKEELVEEKGGREEAKKESRWQKCDERSIEQEMLFRSLWYSLIVSRVSSKQRSGKNRKKTSLCPVDEKSILHAAQVEYVAYTILSFFFRSLCEESRH